MKIARSKSWLKKQKQKLRKKLSEVSKSEGVEIVKTHLDTVYDTYSNLIGLIPDIEKRIKELRDDERDIRNSWKGVLSELEKLKNRPKATKLYYAKRVVSKIKKLRKKYPDE